MEKMFILLIGCTFLAYLVQRSEVGIYDERQSIQNQNNLVSGILFLILCIVLILFSGLRTTMNDTGTYIRYYENEVSSEIGSVFTVDYNIGRNPFFHIYQIILKSFITKNGNGFLLITATIVISSYLIFIKKYSRDFTYSIYLLIAFGVYGFTNAAIKQTMSMAIGIWAISSWIDKKRITAILLLMVAVLFHPYIIVFIVAFVLMDGIWNEKILFAILVTLIAGTGFSATVDYLTSATALIGDVFDTQLFVDEGMSIFRVAVYLVTPVLSFIARDSIRKNGSKIDFLVINMSVISACFAVLAGIGSAIMFGRMARYFDVFQCLALVSVLDIGVSKSELRPLKAISAVAFAIFYYYSYLKYGGWSADFYHHTSLINVLRNW